MKRPVTLLVVTVITEPWESVVFSSLVSTAISVPSWFLKVTPRGKAVGWARFRIYWLRVTFSMPLLSAKADSPRDVTELGMVRDVRRFWAKDSLPMETKVE